MSGEIDPETKAVLARVTDAVALARREAEAKLGTLDKALQQRVERNMRGNKS